MIPMTISVVIAIKAHDKSCKCTGLFAYLILQKKSERNELKILKS